MTLTLFRPVGPEELKLIELSNWKAFPPRLPEQPIFHPVTNEEYAIQIARDWNVKASGAGFVTRFRIDAEYAARFPKKIVGSAIHEELWVPAEELEEFNKRIEGTIEVIHRFPPVPSLEGIWQPLYAELGGEEAPRMALEKMEIELRAGEYAVRFAGLTADHGTYTLDAEGHLSLHGVAGPNEGRTIPGLYKFMGDTLSICYGLGGVRPEKFATGKDPELYLVNYQRK